jgi:hypothetical protein
LWSKRTIDSFGSIHPEGQETESMPTILCVSENLYLLHATVADIKQTGAQVLVAPSVDRAILLAGSHEPNLIVVIETNPYTNFGTPAALNAVCPRVPLLLLTSKRFESDQIPAGVDFISDYRSPLLRDEIKQLLTLVKVLKD